MLTTAGYILAFFSVIAVIGVVLVGLSTLRYFLKKSAAYAALIISLAIVGATAVFMILVEMVQSNPWLGVGYGILYIVLWVVATQTVRLVDHFIKQKREPWEV
jgi:O-antigen ligase